MSVMIGVSFTQATCCMCGIVYALEDQYMARLLERKESGSTYCPNGVVSNEMDSQRNGPKG